MIRTNDCQTSFSHAPAKWRQVTRKGRRHKVWSKAVERLLSFIHLKGTTRNFGVLVPNITHWRNGRRRKRLFVKNFVLLLELHFWLFALPNVWKKMVGIFNWPKSGIVLYFAGLEPTFFFTFVQSSVGGSFRWQMATMVACMHRHLWN